MNKSNIMNDPLQIVIEQRIRQKRSDIQFLNAKNGAIEMTKTFMQTCPDQVKVKAYFEEWLKYLYTIDVRTITPKKEVKVPVKKDVRKLLARATNKIKQQNAKIIQGKSKPIVRRSKAQV